MTTNRIPDTENTFRATASVLGLLPQIAGFAVGFTGLAYISGWRETTAYYHELGAPWVTSLLTPTQVMQSSISFIILFSFIAFISVLTLIQKDIGAKGLRRWSIFFIFLAFVFYFLSLYFEDKVSTLTLNFLVNVSGYMLVMAAGTTIGELIACLALYEIKWGGYEVYLLYFVVFYGLSYAPSIIGQSEGRLAGDAVLSSLPSTSLVGKTTESWRLVGPCGDKLLLISLASHKEDRLFKLVGADSIEGIRTSVTVKQ